jgi:hypothetical protein
LWTSEKNCHCGIAELRLRSNISLKVAKLRIAIADVLPSSCGISIADFTKSCTCPPLIITIHPPTETRYQNSRHKKAMMTFTSAWMRIRLCYKMSCYKTLKYKTSNNKTLKIQNVKLQNTKFQNVELQNVESYKGESYRTPKYKTSKLTERRNIKCKKYKTSKMTRLDG